MQKVYLFKLERIAGAARAKHVNLHQFVADDVESGQKHSVLHQFGSDNFGNAQFVFGVFGFRLGATGLDVAAQASPSRTRRQAVWKTK